MNGRRFPDRRVAGQELGRALRAYAGREDVIILALPRGGVPVGHEAARMLGVPLDIVLVRKLGVPGREELGFGALASGGMRVLNDEVVRELGIDATTLEQVTETEQRELERRDRAYRGGRSRPDLAGRTVILVDDGLATGSTMRVAIEAVRSERPRHVVVAVPVAPPDTCDELRRHVDEVACVMTPEPFAAIGLWYEDFSPPTDDEVRQLLATGHPDESRPHARLGAADRPSTAPSALASPSERAVVVMAGDARLDGDLVVPPDARGLVVFAHGTGSGRHSPRNRFVAAELQQGAFATLLLDLLTEQEAAIDGSTGELRFDIGLLAERLTSAIDWAQEEVSTGSLPVGLFGASTGAAAAIMAAVRRPRVVRTIVSRGGRPDLAGDALPALAAPTLLIVGGADRHVLELHREVLGRIRAETRLEVVEGAGHLFEEPGALERVTLLARDWFTTHLVPSHR